MISNRIDKVVTTAIRDIPYYKKYKELYTSIADFEALPIINKEIVNRYYNQFVRSSSERVLYSWTSGTTGTPLKIVWNQREYIESYKYLWQLRKKWYNILPLHKVCMFHSSALDGDKIVTKQVVATDKKISFGRCTFNDKDFEYYKFMLVKFEPDWILAPPSILCAITEYFNKCKFKPKQLKYIELNGELVSNSAYKFLRNYYNVPVANLYGSMEFNGIALSCPFGHMHLIKQNIVLECLEVNGYSNIVLTGLTNLHMPLIRYNIGDCGEMLTTQCRCGSENELILHNGRVSELIKFKEKKIDPMSFNSLIDQINFDSRIITQYQVVVKDNTIHLLLLVDEDHFSMVQHLTYSLQKKIFKIMNTHIEVKVTKNPNDIYNSTKKFSNIVYL